MFLHFSPPSVIGAAGDSLAGLREGDQGYFSPPSVLAVAGDWTGGGHSNIGDFRNGTWHLDLAGTGAAPGSSETFQFGQPGDQPVVGDWTGDGRSKIGVVRPDGKGGLVWSLDTNGDGVFDVGDQVVHFGAAGDLVLVGDWNGDGRSKIGVARPDGDGGLVFTLDTNGDGVFDAGDQVFHFGAAGDQVIAGDWSGDGVSKVGVYRDGAAFGAPGVALFSLDSNGSRHYDPAVDAVFLYGLVTDKFVAGNWPPPPPLLPAQFAADGVGPGAAALTRAQLAPVVQ